MTTNETNLKNKTLSSMIWTFSDTIGTQVIQLLVQIILARLLLPSDFGVLGIILVFISLSNVFIDSGFTNGLIREKETTQEDYSTVFFFSLAMSVLLYSLLFHAAGFISTLFHEPRLEAIIRVIGTLLIINALGLIQRAQLTKAINFKLQAQVNVIASVVSGIIAIILAAAGLGVWSLVVKMILLQLIQTVLLISINRWVPSLVFSLQSFNRLFSFGWKLLLSSLLNTLYDNLYYLIIGAAFSPTILGFFTNAHRLSESAASSLTTAVQKVSYPVLSTIKEDEDRLKRGCRKTLRLAVYVISPVMIGLAMTAPVLFEVILGENWIPAIPYFQILCIAGLFYPLISINANMLQVQGRSDWFLFTSILTKMIGMGLIFLAFALNRGINGLLWATVLDSALSYILFAHYTSKVIPYTLVEQVKDLGLTAFITGIMAGSLSLFYLFSIPYTLLWLLLQILFGCVVYIGVSALLHSSDFNEVLDACMMLVRKMSGRQKRYLFKG